MKAIFLDRDGTINIDHGYIHKVEDFELIHKAVEGLRKLQENQFKLFVITDQSGIGRGYYTIDDFRKVTEHLSQELKKQGIKLEKTYYCEHAPEEKCECRKPNIKMLLDAQKEYNIDLEKSYFIGDKNSDILAGKRAGCRTVLVLTGQTKSVEECETKPDFVAEDLVEAAEMIEADGI